MLTLAGRVNVWQKKSTHPQEPQWHGHTGREELGRYTSSHDRRAWKASSRSKSEELYLVFECEQGLGGWWMVFSTFWQWKSASEESHQEERIETGQEQQITIEQLQQNSPPSAVTMVTAQCSLKEWEETCQVCVCVFVSKRALRVLNPELASSNDGCWPIKLLIFLFTEKGGKERESESKRERSVPVILLVMLNILVHVSKRPVYQKRPRHRRTTVTWLTTIRWPAGPEQKGLWRLNCIIEAIMFICSSLAFQSAAVRTRRPDHACVSVCPSVCVHT